MLRPMKILAIATLCLPGLASAIPIDGEITFSGDFVPTGGVSLSTATGLTFPGNDFDVDDAIGAFAAAGIVQGDTGTINDFSFNPLAPSPVSPLWSISGFSFVLESVTIELQTNKFLVLSGSGYITGAGFEDTAGEWNLTANTLSALFNFSSGTASVEVPEPSTLVLFGLGLLLFAGTSTRRRRARALG